MKSSDQETDLTFPGTVPTSDDWRDAINRVVPAVVVLRVTACRSFDTEVATSSAATGFVVDKKRGIILTNRHVVKPGPVVAQAIFVNHEEIPVYPIYRDPVHDFGFYRYDSKAIQFLTYEEIPLAPEAASVGLEIRVIGNDSSEKVSILTGTIARLDRDAPTYRNDGYNDFNTFYMQAASGTKGGSSGSPVIDRQGRAVALNAGSKLSSSSAFYLPLDRVVRALRILQDGRDSCINNWKSVCVPRGTLQVTFCHKGFDETRRLGLQTETEQMVRRVSPQGEIGMLVVDSVVPGGPSHKHLEPGDVLVRLNGEVTTQFLKMETLLDDSVGKKIVLEIERGGVSLTKRIKVQDLHSITPDHFLEVSGAVLHPLSYQQARNFRFQCGLVYVSTPGYMLYRAGVPRHAIINKFAGVEISQLEDLISVLSKLSKGARVPLQYTIHSDVHRRKSTLVTLDHHDWYDAPKIYTRDDNSGLWTVKLAMEPKPLQLSSCIADVKQGLESLDGQLSSLSIMPPSMERTHEASSHELTNGISVMEAIDANVPKEALIKDGSTVKTNEAHFDVHSSADGTEYSSVDIGETKLEYSSTNGNGDGEATSTTKTNASLAERVIEPTLVMVEVTVPLSCSLDSVQSYYSSGTGVIVHHSEDMGLVAVDRKVVEISACDVMLSFAAFPAEIRGEVVFLHPVYNYALVAYNPSALGAVGASLLRVAELLPEPSLCRGDPVYLVGLSKSLRAKSRKSTVISSCAALNVNSSNCPQYRATNMEVIELDMDFGNTFTGVLCDEHGKVHALWGSFSNKTKLSSGSYQINQFVKGIPIYVVSQLLHRIINGVKSPLPSIRILEVEFLVSLLSKARSFGLPEDWIQALTKKDPVRKQVLRVQSCLAGSNAENLLKEGDMLLAINKEPVTCFRDIENACHKLENDRENDEKLNITIFREGCELEVAVGTNIRSGSGTTRAVSWCGCTLHEPHSAVRSLGFLPKEGHGVYVSAWYLGSPAHRYGLYSLRWIVEVNGTLTPDLDSFINVTRELGSEEYIRIKTITLTGEPRVITVKPDLHYWPTWELKLDPETGIWRRMTIKAADCGAS